MLKSLVRRKSRETEREREREGGRERGEGESRLRELYVTYLVIACCMSRNRLIGSNARYVIRELLRGEVLLRKYRIIDS